MWLGVTASIVGSHIVVLEKIRLDWRMRVLGHRMCCGGITFSDRLGGIVEPTAPWDSLSLASYLVGHTHQLRYILCYTRCRGPEAHASRGRRIIHRGSLGIRSTAQKADRQFPHSRHTSSSFPQDKEGIQNAWLLENPPNLTVPRYTPPRPG